MNCPVCNQRATSFLRILFTLQGVSFADSLKGYLKCKNCGTLLKITSNKWISWFVLVPIIIVLLIFLFIHNQLIKDYGVDTVVLSWIAIIFIIMALVLTIIYRKCELQVVEER